ncbi:MAG: glycosyltransferase family 2 protein [Pseudomonadota bacterium]
MSDPILLSRRLIGLPCPPEWRAGLWREVAVPEARKILTMDAVRTATQTRVIFADVPDTRAILGGISLRAGRRALEAVAHPTGRGVALVVEEPLAEVQLWRKGLLMTQLVAEAETQLFAGRNVLFALIMEQSPEAIADWARVNVAEQGADAVLLMRRWVPGMDLAAADMAVLSALKGVAGLDVAVVASTEHPIGAANSPAMTSHFHAPDGPGKARRDYENDLWRAPLSDMSLYDVAQHRFLAEARAVLHCDVADLFPRGDGETVFDAAAASETYLKFQGQRVYPWRMDAPETPRHADHACYRFDGADSENVWAVAPTGPLKGAVWRPYRVSTEAPDAASGDHTYYRCQALRTPGEPAAALAPKSGLLNHDALCDFVAQHFGETPQRGPEPLPAPPPGSLKNDRVLLVTTMKNEGPFILEWLAYHRAIGVTDFLVYTNDCTDGTDTMFDLLHEKGVLTHKQNPYREVNMKPQHAAYLDAQDTPQVAAADWVMCMDVDEYIAIHVGDGTLADLFAAVPDANMISMTWRLFGNGDLGPFTEDFTTERFTACAPEYIRKPHQAWGFKTMFRPLGYYRKFGVHRPKGLKPEALHLINWVNGSGEPQPDFMLRTGWRSTVLNWGYTLVTLNHYAVRSAESYLVKRDRGRVNHVDRDQGLAYWFRMNNNAETSHQIQRMIPAQRAEFERFMADPDIAAQHRACVAAHREKIAELMERPDMKVLYDEVMGERLTALSKMHSHFGTATFLAGPDVIPQDFHLREDPGFFSPDEAEDPDADDGANAAGGD